MQTIKVILAESGRVANLKKDFPLYVGSYQNKLLNVLVPKSILAPKFTSNYIDSYGVVKTEDGAYTAIKVGMTYLKRTGEIKQSTTYFMRYLKDVVINNVEYSMYERKLPKEFTLFEGQGENAPRLIVNVVNLMISGGQTNTLEVITSQYSAIDVMYSAELNNEPDVDPTDLELITGQINDLFEQIKDNKNTVLKVNIYDTLPTGVIYELNGYKSEGVLFYNAEFLISSKLNSPKKTHIGTVLVVDFKKDGEFFDQTEVFFFEDGIAFRVVKLNSLFEGVYATQWQTNISSVQQINDAGKYLYIDENGYVSLRAIQPGGSGTEVFVNGEVVAKFDADSKLDKNANAASATKDEIGNVIHTTYATKNELEQTNNEVDLLQNNKADKTMLSNPNLLINGDFRVNQRGQTSYTGAGVYTVDRWRVTNNATSLNVVDNGVELSSTTSNGYMQQLMENAFNGLKGKIVTYSVCINGQVLSATGTVPNSLTSQTQGIAVIGNSANYAAVGLYVYANGNIFAQIGVKAGQTINVEWAKLEIGSVATAFSPRPYAEELALCQRYYFTTGAITSKTMLLKAQSNYDFYQNFIFFPVQMRTNPTVTVYGGANGYVNSLPTRNDDSARLAVTSDGTLGSGNGFLVYATNGDAVENTQYRLNGFTADAEVY